MIFFLSVGIKQVIGTRTCLCVDMFDFIDLWIFINPAANNY